MPNYTLQAARTRLSELVARAEAGEDIVLVRGKKSVAKIVSAAPKRRFGRLKGKGSVGPEFFEPLPEDELRLWE